MVRTESRSHFRCEWSIIATGKRKTFCWWTGTKNPSEMQGEKTCRLVSNDKTRKRCRTQGPDGWRTTIKPVTKGHRTALRCCRCPFIFDKFQEKKSSKHKQKERAADFSTALNCCTEATIRSHWKGYFASFSHGWDCTFSKSASLGITPPYGAIV